MQRFLLSAILFFLVLLTFSMFFFFYETQFFGSRASVAVVDISAENSYVFSTPLRAKADGAQKIRVTVFALNTKGQGVFGKKVSLVSPPHVSVAAEQNSTDTTGKAMFDLSSPTAGEYYIEVMVEDLRLPQKVRIQFD